LLYSRKSKIRQLSPSLFVLLLASTLLLFGLSQQFNPHLLYTVTLLWIGALLGATLNFFQYGFSSSFRLMILEKRTVGMRDIIVLLGVAILNDYSLKIIVINAHLSTMFS